MFARCQIDVCFECLAPVFVFQHLCLVQLPTRLVTSPQVPGMMTVRHGGFVKNADCFDASFFGLSPAESKVMDPQQRLLLEVIYQSFHASGKLGL